MKYKVKEKYRNKVMTGNKLRYSFNTSEIKEIEIPYLRSVGFGYIFEEEYYQEQIEYIDLEEDEVDYKPKKSPKRKKK